MIYCSFCFVKFVVSSLAEVKGRDGEVEEIVLGFRNVLLGGRGFINFLVFDVLKGRLRSELFGDLSGFFCF